MKKLLFLLLVAPVLVYGQEINEQSNGYKKVVVVEMTKNEIYTKAKEWIVVNYKSAKDVIQLDTEDKIIIKGNFTYNYPNGEAYGVRHTTTISIRDNKYKIDLIPTSIFIKSTMKDALPGFKNQFFEREALTIDEFIPWHKDRVIKIWRGQGISEKRIKKLTQKHLTEAAQMEQFEIRKAVFAKWDDTIKSNFSSIENHIKLQKDDW